MRVKILGLLMTAPIRDKTKEFYKYLEYRSFILVMFYISSFLLGIMHMNMIMGLTAWDVTVIKTPQEYLKDSMCKNNCAASTNQTIATNNTPHGGVGLDPSFWTLGPVIQYNPLTRGWILSFFYVGLMSTQIIKLMTRGYDCMNTPNSYCGLLGLTAFFSVTVSLVLEESLLYVVIINLFQGICYGCIHINMEKIWKKWASCHYALRDILTVEQLGMFLNVPLLYGIWGMYWQLAFVMSGIQVIFLAIVGLLCMKRSPADDKNLSENKRLEAFKVLRIRPTQKVEAVRLAAIFKSQHFLGTLICEFAHKWCYFTMLNYFPVFLKDFIKYEIEDVGYIVTGPFLLMMLLERCTIWLPIQFAARGATVNLYVKKIFICFGFAYQAFSFFTASCDIPQKLKLALLTYALAFQGSTHAEYKSNLYEISHKYAGVHYDICNIVGSLAGLIAVLLNGFLLFSLDSDDGWSCIFYIASTLCMAGCCGYLALGSTKMIYYDKERVVTPAIFTVGVKKSSLEKKGQNKFSHEEKGEEKASYSDEGTGKASHGKEFRSSFPV